MHSIIPGYEYDIFISYRQNDNQDGWVTCPKCEGVGELTEFGTQAIQFLTFIWDIT